MHIFSINGKGKIQEDKQRNSLTDPAEILAENGINSAGLLCCNKGMFTLAPCNMGKRNSI